MDARTQRTVMRLLAVFLAAGAGDAIIQYLSDGRYDWRHLTAALGAAAIVSAEQYLKNSGDNAPPTVKAVDAAFVDQATLIGTPLVASVVPPKKVVPPLTTDVPLANPPDH